MPNEKQPPMTVGEARQWLDITRAQLEDFSDDNAAMGVRGFRRCVVWFTGKLATEDDWDDVTR